MIRCARCRRVAVVLTGALVSLGGPVAWSSGADPLLAAVRGSKPLIDIRLRSEQVDQDGLAERADALTLRARLGFETGQAWKTSMLAEGEALWPLQDRYNSTTNGHTGFPVVNDPESYEINRLQLANTA